MPDEKEGHDEHDWGALYRASHYAGAVHHLYAAEQSLAAASEAAAAADNGDLFRDISRHQKDLLHLIRRAMLDGAGKGAP